MEVDRPFFLQGQRCVSQKNGLPFKSQLKQPQSISITSPDSQIRICFAFCKLKKTSVRTKLRGKSKEGGRSPLLGRFKGFAKGEIEIPLSLNGVLWLLSFADERRADCGNGIRARETRFLNRFTAKRRSFLLKKFRRFLLLFSVSCDSSTIGKLRTRHRRPPKPQNPCRFRRNAHDPANLQPRAARLKKRTNRRRELSNAPHHHFPELRQ